MTPAISNSTHATYVAPTSLAAPPTQAAASNSDGDGDHDGSKVGAVSGAAPANLPANVGTNINTIA